jgi:hypothetical protein
LGLIVEAACWHAANLDGGVISIGAITMGLWGEKGHERKWEITHSRVESSRTAMSRALNNVRDGAKLKPPCARMGWTMEAAAISATEVAVNETILLIGSI